jgi:Cu/Ag efflux pump CusA
MIEFEGGEKLEKRKLELVFIDKNGKVYPLDEVSRAELAEGLEKISREIAKRLLLVKEQR